jgi:hypothetical protein
LTCPPSTLNIDPVMNELILQVLNKINEAENGCFDLTNLNLKELKEALKEEGYSKHSKPSEIEEGILDLFDTIGCSEFGIIED